MNIYHRLDDLANTSQLPDVANVHIRVFRKPFKSDDGGGKWLMDVVSPSGNSKAIVSVLIAPGQSGVQLPYSETSKELLSIFENRRLREIFQPGEEVLVQAVPKRGIRDGETVLYLNVPTVAIARPNLLFGRTVIDFASTCERRTFLAVAKAVRKLTNRTGGYSSSIVGGRLGHDLVSAYAVGNLGKHFEYDASLVDHISDHTLSSLVWLGLCSDSDTDISIACRRGINSLKIATTSQVVNNLFQSDEKWIAESDSLNNGVNASPDLLATRTVVELKQVDITSEKYDQQKLMRQVEGYLAWSMVEFGVDNVCHNWTGVLLNIHEKTPESDRLLKCEPRSQYVGWRILSRHKQLGSMTGRWLPSPNEGECEYCAFSKPTSGLEHLPAPCTYYCQTERHWACIDEERECPLLGICDQYDEYEQYERLDDFNRLRQEMLEEEEEQETIREIIRMMTSASQPSLAMLAGFSLRSQNGTKVQLSIPREISDLTFACYGDRFSVLDENDLEIGKWKFVKRKRDALVFETGCHKPIDENSTVSLRIEPGGRIQIRDQLSSLDIDQRNRDRPLSLRYGTRRKTEVRVREWKRLDDLPNDAPFVLINTFEKNTAQAVTKQLINNRFKGLRVLVISENCDLGKDASNLTIHSLRSVIPANESFLGSVIGLVKTLRESNVIIAGFEELSTGQIGRLVERKGEFDAVIVLCAEELPLLSVSKCIDAGKSVFLIGNRESIGTRTESSDRQGSLLGENPIRYLTEVGAIILPEPISFLDIVDLPVLNAPLALKDFPGFRNEITCDIPVRINVVDATEISSCGFFTVMGQAENSKGKSVAIELDLAGLQKLPMGQARQLLKSLNPLAIERLSSDIVGKLDSSILGYTARVTDRTVENSDAPHAVVLKVPVSEFRYVEEFHLTSAVEVDAIVARKKEIGINEDCIACSPFLGQCVALANKAAALGVRLPVFTTSTLVTKRFGNSPVLFVSLVANQSQSRFPHPLDDPRSILPILGGPWKRIEFFCTSHVAENYPLIKMLCGDSQITW